MDKIGFVEFWGFMVRERKQLRRFLKWTAEMDNYARPKSRNPSQSALSIQPKQLWELLPFSWRHSRNKQRDTMEGTMNQDSKWITNRRSFLMTSAAAAGLVLYPETLLFGQ